MIGVIAETGPPSAGGSVPVVVWILAVIVSGPVAGILWSAYMRHKRGTIEDQDLIAQASKKAVEASREMLEESRIQLGVVQAQLKVAQEQITELNRLLGAANSRIARLEEMLVQAHTDNERLHRQLEEARGRRDELLEQMAALQGRVSQLEDVREEHRPFVEPDAED